MGKVPSVSYIVNSHLAFQGHNYLFKKESLYGLMFNTLSEVTDRPLSTVFSSDFLQTFYLYNLL